MGPAPLRVHKACLPTQRRHGAVLYARGLKHLTPLIQVQCVPRNSSKCACSKRDKYESSAYKLYEGSMPLVGTESLLQLLPGQLASLGLLHTFLLLETADQEVHKHPATS
jgi:hypothetical protein